MKLPTLILAGVILLQFHAYSADLEVAFSIQNDALSWFSVNDPNIQGSITVSGLPGTFEGNALAYDDVNNRLLFVNGPEALNHRLYAVSLEGLTLEAGLSVNAGAVSQVGMLSFQNEQALYGAGFYNGSYYAQISGSDRLVKVNFLGTNVSTTSVIDLNSNDMQLGDLAFDANGDLWISGYRGATGSNASLWHFEANTFDLVQQINFAQNVDRYNGIFFDASGTELYGYKLQTNQYGMINQSTGDMSLVYTGSPFNAGGDLTDGIIIQVVPEPSSALLLMASMTVLLVGRRRSRR